MPSDQLCQNEEEERFTCSREMKGIEGGEEENCQADTWSRAGLAFLLSPFLALALTRFTAILTLTKLWFKIRPSRRTHGLSVKFKRTKFNFSFFFWKLQCYEYNPGIVGVGSVSRTSKGMASISTLGTLEVGLWQYRRAVPRSFQSSTLMSCQHPHKQPCERRTAQLCPLQRKRMRSEKRC